jgi:hypothetical protein
MLPDDELAGALQQLATSIAFPNAGRIEPGAPDLATRTRRRIELNPPRSSIWQRLGVDGGFSAGGGRTRPMRRSLVLALIALLALAAVAGAVGLGLPGLRIIFGQGPSPTPSPAATFPASPSPSGPGPSGPSPSATILPLGGSLGLGDPLPFTEVERLAGFDVLLPTDPAIGQPDVAYLNGQRVALVWASRAELPETNIVGVGLVLGEFRGHLDAGLFQKIIGDGTTVTPVTVDGSPGYWISGSPHFFMYVDPLGQVVSDESRVVGDVLAWTTGDVTYRLETSLDRAAAIKLAESLR